MCQAVIKVLKNGVELANFGTKGKFRLSLKKSLLFNNIA